MPELVVPPVRSFRFWAVRLAVLAVAVAVGLAGNSLVAAHLASIQELAKTDVLAARAQLAFVLQGMAVGLFGGIAALGVWLAGLGRRGMALAQFPPPGMVGWGTARVHTGAVGRRAARFAFALALLLVAASLAGGALTWWMAVRLLACRAGAAG